MNYEDMSSDEVWQCVCNGDQHASEEWIRRFEKVILAESKLYGRVNEDVAQDVREKLIRAIYKELLNNTSGLKEPTGD